MNDEPKDDDRMILTDQGQQTLACIQRARELGIPAGDFMAKAQAIADQAGVSLERLLRITAIRSTGKAVVR